VVEKQKGRGRPALSQKRIHSHELGGGRIREHKLEVGQLEGKKLNSISNANAQLASIYNAYINSKEFAAKSVLHIYVVLTIFFKIVERNS
jgi:hypothetical protein